MTKINLLTQNLIDKIAAGEVVVNGASVLKELIENAVDAKAQNITIRVDRGGKSLISVEDDGEGITKDDIPLAFMRNATRKITDSIDAVETLGFRAKRLQASLLSQRSF
jgi:DNA mismatch repair protein MutL